MIHQRPHPLIEAGYKIPSDWNVEDSPKLVVRICHVCKKAFDVHARMDRKKYFCSFKCRAIGK